MSKDNSDEAFEVLIAGEQIDDSILEPDCEDLLAVETLEPDIEELKAPDEDAYFDDAIKLYLRDIQKTKLLTAEDERELATKILTGDKAARDRMIESNLRLVVKIAKRYINRGLPFLDLIEEGNLGLIKAVERFKISKECRFSTYATWWIRQSIERALINQSRTIRLPVHVSDDINRMLRFSRDLMHKLNREPSVKEVSDAMNVDQVHVRRLMVLLKKTYSIERPMGENSDYFLSDTIEDTSTVSPSELLENLNRYGLVSEWFESLSEAEKSILTLRFGLEDAEPQTLDTIGKQFGVTRERIRQIESKALDKLRKMKDGAEK
jgi:RNA polymerase primary sigma factor